MEPSNSAIDRLGERLRAANEPADADKLAYDTYRQTFQLALSNVEEVLASNLAIEGIGSRPKTLESTIAKLRRQTARLSQINDIAGCRIVVERLADQDRVVKAISERFDEAIVRDFRDRPQSGYRAVHIIVDWQGRPVEIQVRTRAQNLWANISEAASDRWGIEVKYGGGPDEAREVLDEMSLVVGSLDAAEQQLAESIQEAQAIDRAVDALDLERAGTQALGTDWHQQRARLEDAIRESRGTLDAAHSAIVEAGVALTKSSDLLE